MYLYGAGGHAKVIMDVVEAQGLTVEGIVDDDPTLKEFMGLKILHMLPQGVEVLVSIGYNEVRRKVVQRIEGQQVRFVTGIHPSAVISPHAVIGEGTVVMQGAIIQSCTQIGKHCIVNSGASIDHDCMIGDFAHISPHATLCGTVSVGEGSWIGAGAVVIPGVKIGKGCMIGAGSVVLHDVPDGGRVAGNPAKPIKG